MACPPELTRVYLFKHNGQVMNRVLLLRISNYEYFVAYYTNTHSFYVSPCKILLDLEGYSCYKTDTPKDELVSYKNDGDCIFKFTGLEFDGNDEFAVYEFQGTIS